MSLLNYLEKQGDLRFVNIDAIADQLSRERNESALQSAVHQGDHSVCEEARIEKDLRGAVRRYTNGGVWQHRELLSINDFNLPGVAYSDLNEAAMNYFSSGKIRHDDLDWFYVDILIAYSNRRMVERSESLVADETSGEFSTGVKALIDGRYSLAALLLGYKLLKVSALLCAVFGPLFFASQEAPQFMVLSLGAIGYYLISVFFGSAQYKAKKHIFFERIWTINQIYLLVGDFRQKIDWKILEKEIARGRVSGVPWLSALDFAINTRLAQQQAAVEQSVSQTR